MYQYHVYEGLTKTIGGGDYLCAPKPLEKVVPLVMMMGIYTILVPGVPFVVAIACGWGVVLVSCLSHICLWSTNITPGENAHYDVLAAQMTREILYNTFGTFVAYEYVQQLRLNYWHMRFLKEALIVQKQARVLCCTTRRAAPRAAPHHAPCHPDRAALAPVALRFHACGWPPAPRCRRPPASGKAARSRCLLPRCLLPRCLR